MWLPWNRNHEFHTSHPSHFIQFSIVQPSRVPQSAPTTTMARVDPLLHLVRPSPAIASTSRLWRRLPRPRPPSLIFLPGLLLRSTLPAIKCALAGPRSSANRRRSTHIATWQRINLLFRRMVCGSTLGLRQVLVSMRRLPQHRLLRHLRSQESGVSTGDAEQSACATGDWRSILCYWSQLLRSTFLNSLKL